MGISATDANGKFTAEYAAYTKLVIANRVQSQVNGNGYGNKKSMSFEQFMEAIRKDQVVNHNYARPVSAEETRNNQISSCNCDSFPVPTPFFVSGLHDR